MTEVVMPNAGVHDGAERGTAADPRLVTHLAAHHEPCPFCRFDLHALRSDRCPECGGHVRIGVVAAKARNAAFLTLMTPIVVTAVLGIAGMAFSTFVRNERDDWQVGLMVTIGAGVLALIHVMFRQHGESLRGKPYMVSVITLWVICFGAAGLAFFLDI